MQSNQVTLTFSVLVPTCRRPAVLLECVAALAKQTLPPVEVVVTVRGDDTETWTALDTIDRAALGYVLKSIPVEPGPVTAAMNAGLAETLGEIIAVTDDDAAPRSDWLERMAAHFADPSVGGVGGRDWQPYERWDEPVVGRLQWFGRVVANHHLGSGPAREVQVLKGVNCAYRGDAFRRIGLDSRMRGRGTVIHWELALSFAFLREGWRLIYDPAVAVDHNIVPRHDGDNNQRGDFEHNSYIDMVHNETLSLLDHLSPVRRVAFALWATLVGTREAPGLAQVPRLAVVCRESGGARFVLRKAIAAIQGRLRGAATWMRQTPKARP